MRRLMSRFGARVLACMLVALAGCIEPYAPDVLNSANRFLVVDGFINGNGTTTITLTRSTNLDSKTTYPPELRATVSIENQSGRRYPLSETRPGVYTSPSQTLPPDQQYHLRIRTGEGREYTSDFLPLKRTPPIDRFAAELQPNGVQLYISAHDDSQQTQYYRWEYVETWEFTSAYESYYRYIGNNRVALRGENIYRCWRTENSSSINTTSTVRLSQDAVRDYRLLFLPNTDTRLRYGYSMLVRQYALSQAEFDYWEAIKKNTENIGTLFDPLPSQIQGNVHALADAGEPVLGFVGVSSVVEKRIFIDRNTLPFDWSFDPGYHQCLGLDTFPSIRYQGWTYDEFFGDSTFRVPVGRVRNVYTAQTSDCVDCRLRGSNVKPGFWP